MKKMVTLRDVQQAQKTIKPYAIPTPLARSKFLSELCSGEVFLKLENQQVTHSFKIRGVINKLLNLSTEEKARGVVTAFSGESWPSSSLWCPKTWLFSANRGAFQYSEN